MKGYKEIYHWDAFDKVKEGKEVYVADKQEHTVFLVNVLSVNTFASMLRCSDSDRFYWWVEEETEESDG